LDLPAQLGAVLSQLMVNGVGVNDEGAQLAKGAQRRVLPAPVDR
jgi:hypothetical protein